MLNSSSLHLSISLEDMHIGGGPRFALELGTALRERGHHVTIVVQQPGPWWPEVERCGLAGWLQPVPFAASRQGQARRLADFWNASRTDAILINISRLNSAAQSALHLVDDRISLIPVLHGDWMELYRIAGELAPLWNAAVTVSPAVHRSASAILLNKPIINIHYGVDIPDERTLHTRADWSTPLRLLFVGRLIDAHKGILRLPQILAACRARGLPVHLTIVGDGPDRAALEQKIAAGGVSDLVDLRGALPPRDATATMLDHHVLLLPSNTEGLPLVMLEAMAAGCVVVASHLPGITDAAIDDDVHGRLTAPGDIAHWVDHIADMLIPETWRRISAAAAARARTQFSAAAMGARYEAVLHDAVGGAYPLPRSRRDFTPPFGLRDRVPTIIADRIPESIFRVSQRLRAAVRKRI